MSRGFGRLTPVPEEAYSLRELMEKGADSKYEIVTAIPEFPPSQDHATWYLLGKRTAGHGSIPYASIAWESDRGQLFIQSIYLGNTNEWLEASYGEDAVISGMKIDYRDFQNARGILAKNFPAVERTLQRYEKALAKVSSKESLNLTLRCDGVEGLATFYLLAKIDINSSNRDQEVSLIRRHVNGLRECWEATRRRSFLD
jgi:hypothetical protein